MFPDLDPIRSALSNSIRGVRDALFPLESAIRRAAEEINRARNFELIRASHGCNGSRIQEEGNHLGRSHSDYRKKRSRDVGSLDSEKGGVLQSEVFARHVFDVLGLNLEFDHMKLVASIIDIKRLDKDEFGFNSRLAIAVNGGNGDDGATLMCYLSEDNGESISYGATPVGIEVSPCSIQCKAADLGADAHPIESATESIIKSALAGGIACSFSTAIMHPVDTVKTCVQASTISFSEVISKLPEVGLHGLYRGSIPAILGQFISHGLRTGFFEACRSVLSNVAPDLPDIQVQSLASFSSTMLGTASRIPSEVLKQRLQVGMFDNVGEAILGTLQQDGIKGFFRGTKATLIREVPFYVIGPAVYDEAKKAVKKLLRRELEPWEAMVVGALSGGLTAVCTTPLDVMKTRMMIAPPGSSVPISMVFINVLNQEGLSGLYRGAVPRFFWVAPLGAINFAGYELIRKAMDGIALSSCKSVAGEETCVRTNL